jgi:hypothetical protein
MGGFKLFDDEGPVRTLNPDELQSLAQKGEIDFPCITEDEILDKSKGDMLSKGLVVIQTGWFILQCIARRIEHLPLTELELVTLAFAALNFVTYGLWWNKPLNVQCPFRVPVKQRTGESEGSRGAGESSQNADGGESGEDSGGQDTDAMAVFGILIASIVDAMRGGISKTLEAMGKVPGAIVHAIWDAINRSVEYVHKHRWRTFRIGAWAVFDYGIEGPLDSFIAMGFGTVNSDKVGTMFYAQARIVRSRGSLAFLERSSRRSSEAFIALSISISQRATTLAHCIPFNNLFAYGYGVLDTYFQTD